MRALLDGLDRLARRRLPEPERRALESFRADIDARWRPSTPVERRLDRRARLVHLATAAFDGGVSLACVGCSGLLTALGSTILTVTPPSANPAYDSQVPPWIGALLTLGILALALECARSPRALRPATFALLSVPLAVGCLAGAATARVMLFPDATLSIAMVLIGVGASLAALASLARRPVPAHRGLWLMGVGALGVCFSDGVWVVLFVFDGAPVLAIGCALSAIGAILMANGLLFARPSLPTRRSVRGHRRAALG